MFDEFLSFINDEKDTLIKEVKEKFGEKFDILKSVYETIAEKKKFNDYISDRERVLEDDFDSMSDEDVDKFSKYIEVDNEIFNIYKPLILDENLPLIIKKYPTMAFQKSNYLKIFYNSLESYKKSETTKLFSKPSNIEGKIYYRGRYFKDTSPYNSDSGSSYLEMTQAPFYIKKSKGRYDGDRQSRFYIVDNIVGVYFEAEKYKIENKNRDLYVQEFKLKNEKSSFKNDVISININFETNFSQNRVDESGIVYDEIIKEMKKSKLREKYDKNLDVYAITNYVADMANSLGFKGIEYVGTKLKDFDQRYSHITFKNEKVYKNLVVFSDGWTEGYTKFNMDKHELESYEKYCIFFKDDIFYAEDYFEPNKNYPLKLNITDVIIKFNEMIFPENHRINSNNGMEYYLKIEFEKLLKGKELHISEFFQVNTSKIHNVEGSFRQLPKFREYLERNGEKDIIEMDMSLREESFKQFLELITPKKETDRFNFREHMINRTYEDYKYFKFYYDINAQNFNKIEINSNYNEKIFLEYLELFHEVFGIYYNISFDDINKNVSIINV